MHLRGISQRTNCLSRCGRRQWTSASAPACKTSSSMDSSPRWVPPSSNDLLTFWFCSSSRTDTIKVMNWSRTHLSKLERKATMPILISFEMYATNTAKAISEASSVTHTLHSCSISLHRRRRQPLSSSRPEWTTKRRSNSMRYVIIRCVRSFKFLKTKPLPASRNHLRTWVRPTSKMRRECFIRGAWSWRALTNAPDSIVISTYL